MSSPPKTTNSVLGHLWRPNMVGILTIWKLGQNHFQIFRTKALSPSQDAVANVRFEKVVVETMVSMAAPPCHIHVQTTTEVEVLACDSQEAIVLHRERTDEVDFMIEVIDMVEREYWGDMFV